MVSTQVVKGLVLVVLLVTTFLFSMLPLKLMSFVQKQTDRQRRRKFRAAISLLSCYAAGVFLATCLLDLFPEVQEDLNDAFDQAEIFTAFPFSQFVMAFGFFIILIVEQIVLSCKDSHESDPAFRPLLGSVSSMEASTTSVGSNPAGFPRRYHALSADPLVRSGSTISDPGFSGPPDSLIGNISRTFSDDSESSDDEVLESGLDQGSLSIRKPNLQKPYQDPASHSVIRSLMLLVALSLHSIFEGLAVGLQPTTSNVLQICAALALHKCILAFSLGMSLVHSKLGVPAIIKSNFIFSLTSPIGVGIGIGISDLEGRSVTSSLLTGILQGLACGTFLYVVFFEILPHEFNSTKKHPSRLLKVLLLLLGFSTVCMLLFLDPTVVKPRFAANCAHGATNTGFRVHL